MISKNLIFDIDGTLWDATHQICEAYNEIITKENKNYPLITDDMMAGVMGLLILLISFFHTYQKVNV